MSSPFIDGLRAAVAVAVDLTSDADDDDVCVVEPPGEKRRRVDSASVGSSKPSGKPEYLSLPGGVLDDAVLARVDAVCQQLNW